MSLMVHFMHPTKHWLLGRVHAVHHEIEIPSIDNCVGPVSPVQEYPVPFCLVACVRNHARNRDNHPKTSECHKLNVSQKLLKSMAFLTIEIVQRVWGIRLLKNLYSQHQCSILRLL